MRQPSVYFIQAGQTGMIKIGRTSNIRKRMQELQVSNPDKLLLLGQIGPPHSASYWAHSGGRMRCDSFIKHLERTLHEQFRDLRIRGDWFKPDGKLLQFIESESWKPGWACDC